MNLSNCSEHSAVTPRILSQMVRFKSLEVLNLDNGFVTSTVNGEFVKSCRIARIFIAWL